MSLLKTLLRAALALALLASGVGLPGAAAAAQPEAPIAAALGNTIVVTYPDGRTQRLWLQPNGRWVGENRNGHPRSGSWSLGGRGSLCLRQSEPATVPLSYCTSVPRVLRVGDHWTGRDLLGRRVAMALVPGVVPGGSTRGADASAAGAGAILR